MADLLKIDITGARQAGLRFDEFPQQLYDDLSAEIDALGHELYKRIVAALPDKHATGRLASQIKFVLYTDPNSIKGRISLGSSDANDFKKTATLEYGSQGKVITLHRRFSLIDKFARMFSRSDKRLKENWTRPTNVPAFRFERDPTAELQPEILARLNAVVENLAKQVNDA